MNRIIDILERTPQPVPWAEGDNIPWNDPGFSARMLNEHLSQAHQMASRRFDRIDTHIDWIHTTVLGGEQSRILDLGCGPGFYASRLAKLGHECVGIDYSPASIGYAREQAAANGLSLSYTEGDIRSTDYGQGCDLIMLIFGELNVFSRSDAEGILAKAYAALRSGGQLLLETSTAAAVKHGGQGARSWYTSSSGLFSDRPHLVLQEHFWDSEVRAATTRYFIVDAETHAVTRHASSSQAYQDDELRGLLRQVGFEHLDWYGGLSGQVEAASPGSALNAWTARKA